MRTRVNYFTENSVRIPKTEFSMLGNVIFSPYLIVAILLILFLLLKNKQIRRFLLWMLYMLGGCLFFRL